MANFRPVTLDDIAVAPIQLTLDKEIKAPRQRVWELLALDLAAWGDWCPGFDHSGHWLSQTPDGAGSVRQMHLGGLTFKESILAHEEGKRWAFRIDSCAVSVCKALAEDYVLTDAPGGCTLHWRFGLWPHGPAGLIRPVAAPAAKTFAGMLIRGLEKAAA